MDKYSSVVELTTYAVKLITDWEEYKEYGEYLFFLFKGEFANWTSDMFGRVKSPFTKRFRDYLHNNGVYTGKNTTAIGSAMVNLLNTEEIPEWSKESDKPLHDQQQQLRQPKPTQQQTIRQSNENQALRSTIPGSKQQLQHPLRPIRNHSLTHARIINPALLRILHILGAQSDKPFDDCVGLTIRYLPNERVDAYTQKSFIKLYVGLIGLLE
ncbi:hypothetical protein GcM1_076004 [Golovinomyces cichoracearum]|uniref:Uncharacterized protein n=1 Tax=Golovinomyces cichoracearum TaxID=62708 RepID=A0A420JCA9_9PEZI|nr:hypothetical protein GcM1_076004 [Golovinomyces cichoracearum]